MKTDFGFQEVTALEKTSKVQAVFNSVATRYDLMNDIMSVWIHRFWKRTACKICALQKGNKVLDLAGGTGDLASLYSRQVGKNGQVILVDPNQSMMLYGKTKRLSKTTAQHIQWVQSIGESLPFTDNTFDVVSIGFGFRNFTDKTQALKEIFRILKPGGRLMILEFSKLILPGFFQRLYRFYLFQIIPLIGKIVTNDSKSYRYLAESIERHPNQAQMQGLLASHGFSHCTYKNLSFGIAAIHLGTKT